MTPGSVFGTLPGGEQVVSHTLGERGGLRLVLLDLGASVQSLWLPDGQGGEVDVVLGGADLAAYTRTPPDFYGAVIGRVANRIAGGELPLDGSVHRLGTNDGANTLHGGPTGFHSRLWTTRRVTDESVTFGLVSPDGDGGFPGELDVEATYTVAGRVVTIALTARAGERRTPVNLTHHAHFNLAGESSGSVAEHRLTVSASHYTPVDDQLLPTGEIRAVDGTPLDLRASRRLGDVWEPVGDADPMAAGLDHNLVLDADAAAAAVLEHPASGRRLTVRTDQPGLQVYSGGFFDGTVVGTGGRPYERFAGIALEAQHFPDSVHHEGEPGWPSVVLEPGESVTHRTTWDFEAGPA